MRKRTPSLSIGNSVERVTPPQGATAAGPPRDVFLFSLFLVFLHRCCHCRVIVSGGGRGGDNRGVSLLNSDSSYIFYFLPFSNLSCIHYPQPHQPSSHLPYSPPFHCHSHIHYTTLPISFLTYTIIIYFHPSKQKTR